MTVDMRTISSDDDFYNSESESHVLRFLTKAVKRTNLSAVMRQSRYGRARCKDSSALTKTHGRIHLSEYTSMKASAGSDATPTYGLMLSAKPPARSHTQDLLVTTLLLDTGASISLMPLWQAKELKLEVKKHTDINVRGADGRP